MALTLSSSGAGGVFTLRGGSFGGRFQASVTPPASATLLLDTYPGAAAAYSLRKLRTAYSGSAIRVRRSSDNTEIDIGFVLNELDTTTLSTFCGAGSGFITVWYDQSGNLKNATQTTTSLQPTVYQGGAIVIRNGKPSISNFGFNRLIASTASGAGNGILYNWCFSVYSNRFLTPANIIVYEVGTNGALFSGGTFGVITGYGISNATIVISSNYEPVQTALSLGTAKSSTIPSIFINGILNTVGTTGFQSSFMTIFADTVSGNNMDGYISELVFYNPDQSANRTGIETNINSYYTIY